jgi:hypothetical protein
MYSMRIEAEVHVDSLTIPKFADTCLKRLLIILILIRRLWLRRLTSELKASNRVAQGSQDEDVFYAPAFIRRSPTTSR